jgi:hypothetical protein
MQKTGKLLFVFGLLVLTAWGSVRVADARAAHDGDGRHRGPRLSGVVTAVTADSITMTRTHHLAAGEPMTHPHRLDDHHPITGSVGVTALINVNSATVVQLIECQCTGALSDVTVGAQIHVKGQRQADGSTTAMTITVSPAGDQLGGAVMAVEGATLTVQGRHGITKQITTTVDTKFFTKEGAAALTDVGVGSKVMAFGVKQADGALVARVVLIRDPAPINADTVDRAALDELVDVLIEDTTTSATSILATRLFLPVIRFD